MRLSKNENLVVPLSNRSSVNGTGVQNKQESSSDSGSESGSDDESDYDSESDEQPEADLPDLLQSARPADLVKAVEYDVVETVWRPPNQRVEPEDIRSALGKYEKLIKELRDKWKQEETSVAQAEEKKDKTLVEKGKARAATRLKILENACRLTEQYGHQDIVGRYVYLCLLLIFWHIVRAHVSLCKFESSRQHWVSNINHWMYHVEDLRALQDGLAYIFELVLQGKDFAIFNGPRLHF